MGTRGSAGIIYQEKEKLGYNQFDSYPDGLGRRMLEIIAKINNENGWEKFKNNFAQLKNIDGSNEITDLEIIEKYSKYANLNVSEQKLSDPYCLFRKIQGYGWIDEVYKGYLQDYPFDNEFIYNSLSCEYAYIINLDTMKLEFYTGFQKVSQNGNRFGEEKRDNYYPCRLVGVFNLLEIFDTELVEKMNNIIETGKDDSSVNTYFRKPKLDMINEKSLIE